MPQHPVSPPDPEHPVAQKLRTEILPYFVSARRLRRQWYCWMHVVFGYTTDILVALTAIGLGSPVISFFMEAGQASAPAATKQNATTLPAVLGAVPPFLYWPMVAGAIFWIVLRVTFNRENGQKRAVLARSCLLSLGRCEAQLPHTLLKPNPMPDLTKMCAEQIQPLVDRNITEEAWPWRPFAPGTEAEVADLVSQQRERFERNWLKVADPDIRNAS